MKIKKILMLSAFWMTIAVNGQTAFEKLETNKDISTVVVSQKMFQMLSKIDSKMQKLKSLWKLLISSKE